MKKKKQQRTRIRNISILVVLIIVIVAAFQIASSDSYAGTREEVLALYLDYDDDSAFTYNDYVSQYSGAYVDDVAETITLGGTDYAEADMDGLTEDGDILWTQESGTVTYEFEVEEAGLYHIQLTYYPDTNSTQTILRNLYINDELPFDDCEDLTITRLWVDDNKDWLMNTDGNQAAPTQVQEEGPGVAYIQAVDCDTVGTYAFYFEEGTNTVTLESTQAALGISEISLVPASEVLSYEEYLEYYTEEVGAEVISANSIDDGAIVIQAEDTTVKSTSALSPNNDRTSVATQPYHSTYIVYNTIGGSNWSSTGQSITWTVTVEEAGLYKIGLRYKQYLNRGFYSARYLTINGDLPFEEAAQLEFYYASGWQIGYLGDDDGDYYFYLEAGENTITMTVTLGELAEAVDLVNVSVDNLNDLYRRITAVTGSDPDAYRDYSITTYVEDMVDILELEYTRLNAVVEMFGETIDSSNKTSSLVEMMTVMLKLIDDPDDVAQYLSDFNDKLSALGDWVGDIDDIPLELDYLVITGEGYELPSATGSFFAQLAHTWNAFIGSFTNDFQVHAAESEEDTSSDKKTLEVWVTTDTRTQYTIIQKMVNAAFADSDYNVNVSMVSAGTVLPATVAGTGPDVVLQSTYSQPVNFAFRNAAYDLTQFEDFEEVAARFPEGAFEFLEYEGGIYGLPDQVTFPVLIYRTDVLESLGLEVPETWDDLIALIPYLEAENMSVYLGSNEYTTLGSGTGSTTIPVNTIFLSMLYQNGLELYSDDNTSTLMDELENMLVFKEWTEYYTKQGLSYSVSVVTRFRTGEIPVMVVDYTYVSTLNVSAPEIAGKWAIAQIPGTEQEDGTVDHSVAGNIGTCFIVSTAVEEDGMAEEAWDFLKWWTSEDTQLTYATEQQATDGEAAIFPVANIAAVENGSLSDSVKSVVLQVMENFRGEPQVPGGYMTGRVIKNAFISVVSNNTDPVDTLYLELDAINTEITNKRTEFGLNTAE